MSGFKDYPLYQSSELNQPTDEDIKHFQSLIGEDYVYNDKETQFAYSHDWTEDFSFLPAVVLKPANALEIARIVQYCNIKKIPITPAGARTGLSGGALPIYGGVVVSVERLNKIIHLDERNLQITVEPGVITQHIHEAVEAVGLFYPPDPSSRGSCMIGGNIAENAGGVRAVKYGVTNEYVLNLQMVTPTGEIIKTGAATLKNSTGLNLTQLIVGSEGILGIVTQATLKLIPKPAFTASMLIPFENALTACETVSAILQAKITPTAIEFIEKDALDFGQKYLNQYRYNTEGLEAHLLISIDAPTEDEIMRQCEAINEVCESRGAKEVLLATTPSAQDELWKLRRCLGEAVKGTTIYKEEDVVAPRAELAKILQYIKKTGLEYGFYSVCYGHAGDGNLHVNIIKNDMTDDKWEKELPDAISKIFQFVVSLGGTLSGEHGIGYVQRKYLPIAFSEAEIQLMHRIKQAFDPNGIMNPGKAI